MSENDDIPIAALADLESPVSAGFLQNVRRRIYRRTASAQFARFTWSLPGAILLEFLSTIVHLFAVVDGKKGRSK